MLCLWVSSDPARSESLEIKVPLSLLQQNQVSDSKKKKSNSTFLCKNWVKSKWNPFVSRLNANKHDPTLHVVKLQHIPRSEARLLESECKWKCISSIYIGQVPTPGTTSSGSGEAGLCLSVWTLSTSASLFPTRQCEHMLLLLRELTNSKWLCVRVYRADNITPQPTSLRVPMKMMAQSDGCTQNSYTNLNQCRHLRKQFHVVPSTTTENGDFSSLSYELLWHL